VVRCAGNDRHEIVRAESVLLGNRLGVRRSSGLSDNLRGAFSEPEWAPHHIALEQNMTQRVTDIVCDVVRRLVLCDDKNAIWTAQQIRSLPQFFLAFGMRQRFDEIRVVVEQKDFDRELPWRQLAQRLSECS